MYFNIAFSFFFSWSLVRFGECALCADCIAVSSAYIIFHSFINSISCATQIFSHIFSPRSAIPSTFSGAIPIAISSAKTYFFAVILAFVMGDGSISVINLAFGQTISHFGDECCALGLAHILTVLTVDSCCQGNDGQDG